MNGNDRNPMSYSPPADPGGGGGAVGCPGPPTPKFGGPSIQFKTSIMNFRALIPHFSLKIFSLTSLGINIFYSQHFHTIRYLKYLPFFLVHRSTLYCQFLNKCLRINNILT